MTSNERNHGVFFKRFHTVKNLFSEQECDLIIKYFEKSIPNQASVVNVEESKDKIIPMRDSTIRDGRVVFCDHRVQELNFAFQKLYYASIWANFGWSVFPLRFLQIAKYDADTDGGFYKRHRDIIHNSKPQRILTSVTQLSKKENYTGCGLIFDAKSNAPISDEYNDQGDTIFFTSIEPHEVTPIRTGTRYSLTAWYEGPTIWNSESEYNV